MCVSSLSVTCKAFVSCIDLPRRSNLLIDLSRAVADIKSICVHKEIF